MAQVEALCERLRVPTECRELAEVVAREHPAIADSAQAGAADIVRLLERCDAWRKPQRFGEILLACECIAGRSPYPQGLRLHKALQAALAVATHEIADAAQQQGLKGPQVGERIQQARVEAVARVV